MGRAEVAKIEVEIRQEKAEALGRAGEKLEQVLGQLWDLRSDLAALDDELGPGAEAQAITAVDRVRQRAHLLEEYDGLWRRAQTYRQHLIIHREALGFRKHGDVDRLYPLPERLLPAGRGDPPAVRLWRMPVGAQREIRRAPSGTSAVGRPAGSRTRGVPGPDVRG